MNTRWKKLSGFFIFAALVMIFAVAAGRHSETLTKQYAIAANPDTAGTLADTSMVYSLPSDLLTLFVTVTGDSTTYYTTQVSPDNGTHWFTVDFDTLPAATYIESTGDLGVTYAGWKLRVIQDALVARSYGRANVSFTK